MKNLSINEYNRLEKLVCEKYRDMPYDEDSREDIKKWQDIHYKICQGRRELYEELHCIDTKYTLRCLAEHKRPNTTTSFPERPESVYYKEGEISNSLLVTTLCIVLTFITVIVIFVNC